MAKYIECEAAYRFAQDQLKKETGAYSKGWNNAMNVMKSAFHSNDALPAADVVPVRHGRWALSEDEMTASCSECNANYPCWRMWPTHYCPNCGAKMDKDGDGE